MTAQASVAETGYVPFAGVDRRACPDCGALLRSGNRPGRDNPRGLCDPCLRGRTVPDAWMPRCDGTFERTWLTHLVSHYGEWCHPRDVWPSRDETQSLRIRQLAHEVVYAAQRVGLDIESDRVLGYRVVGAGPITRYVRPVHEDAGGEDTHAGQLTLAECESVECA